MFIQIKKKRASLIPQGQKQGSLWDLETCNESND